MIKPKVVSIGYAVPDNYYSQEEVFQNLGYSRHFWRVFRESQIEKRHFCISIERITHLSWQEQQEVYQKEALALSNMAISACLDGRSADEVGALIYGSCTGFPAGPAMPHYLARILNLKPSTYYINIAAQGCESGFPGLKRAYDFVMTEEKPALVVNCELSCLTYYPEPAGRPDRENNYELLRANSIFADAAACALVGSDNDPRHPFIIDTETYTDTAYLNDLGYVWRNGRLRVLLSRRVPELAPLVVKPAVEAVLQRQRLNISDIDWWVIHAAGGSVLDNIRDALGIAEEKVNLSRETLREFGNTSSTSVGITGKRLMSQAINPGDYAAVLSIGPGMTGGMTLLKFGE